MTNGRGAGMASFMTKKKKYKFQVEINLEELLAVPFVNAVLFAKLRLLDGGTFQDHSSREEVRDHKVKWGAKFQFPCKMMANASTGILERCILRISIRMESRGGRSFNKLGFVDINLAEYAGAGVTPKKALLEGYDSKHRQDNSMLRFSITMNMLSGDVLFKVPSPSLKHKQVTSEDIITEPRPDEFSGGSLAGSIASGSSGFGSLPKKRPPLLTSELVIGQTLTENNVPVTVATDCNDVVITQPSVEVEETTCEPGHSRNSSNTSQLSKASGYSSIHSHSHSRQSSSGDSGHIRNLQLKSDRTNTNTSVPFKFTRTHTYPKAVHIPNTINASQDELFHTPPLLKSMSKFTPKKPVVVNGNQLTPKLYNKQTSIVSTSSNDEYRTPECSLVDGDDVFAQNFVELQKSSSTSVVERTKNFKPGEYLWQRNSDNVTSQPSAKSEKNQSRSSLETTIKNNHSEGVLRSKSDFIIPRLSPTPSVDRTFSKFFKSDSLFSFLTPSPKRKNLGNQSTPNRGSPTSSVKFFGSPIPKYQLHSLPETRTTSLNSLRCTNAASEGQHITTRNPSSSSLVVSETGSLDRAKAAYERRKKNQVQDSDTTAVPSKVEITRVNPDDLIEELLKNLEQPDDSAETSGLQLFIAKDGTAAVGNHEVKSQIATGAQVFKQVVMDDR